MDVDKIDWNQVGYITEQAERRLGVIYTPDEIVEALQITLGKLAINGKGETYFGCLYENELKDLMTRKTINCIGGAHGCA